MILDRLAIVHDPLVQLARRRAPVVHGQHAHVRQVVAPRPVPVVEAIRRGVHEIPGVVQRLHGGRVERRAHVVVIERVRRRVDGHVVLIFELRHVDGPVEAAGHRVVTGGTQARLRRRVVRHLHLGPRRTRHRARKTFALLGGVRHGRAPGGGGAGDARLGRETHARVVELDEHLRGGGGAHALAGGGVVGGAGTRVARHARGVVPGHRQVLRGAADARAVGAGTVAALPVGVGGALAAEAVGGDGGAVGARQALEAIGIEELAGRARDGGGVGAAGAPVAGHLRARKRGEGGGQGESGGNRGRSRGGARGAATGRDGRGSATTIKTRLTTTRGMDARADAPRAASPPGRRRARRRRAAPRRRPRGARWRASCRLEAARACPGGCRREEWLTEAVGETAWGGFEKAPRCPTEIRPTEIGADTKKKPSRQKTCADRVVWAFGLRPGRLRTLLEPRRITRAALFPHRAGVRDVR